MFPDTGKSSSGLNT